MRDQRIVAAVLIAPASNHGLSLPLDAPSARSARCIAVVCSDRVLLTRSRGDVAPALTIRADANERAAIVVDATAVSAPLDALAPWRVGRWAIASTHAGRPDDPSERERIAQIARSIGPGEPANGAAAIFRQIQLRAHPDSPSYPGALLAEAIGAASGLCDPDGLLVASNGRILAACSLAAPVWTARVDATGAALADVGAAVAFVVASQPPAAIGWERVDRGVVWWDPATGMRVDQLAAPSGGSGA